MNRIIKFRVWDKEAKVMIYAGDFPQEYERSMYAKNLFMTLDGELRIGVAEKLRSGGVDYTHLPYKLGNTILMQFTGLLDKNDVEIYEGDILGIPNSKTANGKVSVTGVVIYDLKNTLFRTENLEGRIASWIRLGNEVIGNIYKNPELLK